ncbi:MULTISPECIES: PD-(D/E)XK nuclease family protein [Haloarcula]|uniref:PD-(D/E)XK nuclease family protein n=1 Tax=Haloarcula TaxID=2237 RepID=UPI0023EDE654|nr:PD-(D/E)XK nuclease family protein [Halomicroarcula sp. XH51]
MAVETLENPSNPLAAPDRFPSAGLCRQVEDLLSLMEFADLHSPAAIDERLESEGLPEQGAIVSALTSAFETVRGEIDESGRRTLRAERYHHVLTSETALSTYLDSVDAVVLAGFTLFSPLERQLVERIVDTWPTVAILPRLNDTTEPVGVDSGVERALQAYSELGFEREYVEGATTVSTSVARQLYRPARAKEDIDTRPIDGALELRQPETIPQELRYVARDIRRRVAAGTPPDDIGVVLTEHGGYHEPLVETFEQYEIPATLAFERGFTDTALGEVVSELVSLSREDPALESVTALLSNPLVTSLDGDVAADHNELANLASRLTSRRLTTAYAHLDDDVETAIKSVVADATSLRDCSLADLADRLETLLDRLGVTTALDSVPKTPRGRTERAARRSLDRTLETLALTDGVADPERADPVDRLERALTGVTLDAESEREDGHVLICGLDDAAPRTFAHTYVLGLTLGHFPSNPERLAFTRPINEAHRDFEQADIQQGARYSFGLLLASDASLTLTVPERDLGGDPYVEADVLTELRRVSELEPEPVNPSDVSPGSREDVQRSLARRFAHDGVDEYAPTIEEAASVGAFDESRRQRLQQGVACAAARASSDLTPYDGQLSPETVSACHGTDSRAPYSPSQLETYAKCGFKYYVNRVLDIKEPDEIGLEPDARERGGFVHDVFERYYADQQTTPGEALPISGDRETCGARLLQAALSVLEDRFEDDPDPTAFQREWLTAVFAGLGPEADNPYYGDDTYGSPERGLFVRFLNHEFDEVSKATARPSWFEARVGDPYGDETVLREEPVELDTPSGPVPVVGKIDRIDAVPGTEPTQLVVRDYKTGGTPSEADTLSGLSFQLPLYAQLAEGALDDVETVGGAYYQTKPPTSVSHRKGLVGSQEQSTYVYSDSVETPMLRFSKPTFTTHRAFREFIETETPRRLGQLTTAIEAGRFQPTVLDPMDAGCRYCGYSDVCDVRSHRRRDVIDEIDDEGVSAYVPLAARDADPADVLEVE